MIAMQYKIKFPHSYDMKVIRERVAANGEKTDGFQDLLFKAYLIREFDGSPGSGNEYAPLYLWKQQEGMNAFIFEGFYDNILRSFGWQQIHIGVPLLSEIKDRFTTDSRFVLEIEGSIPEAPAMKPMAFSMDAPSSTARVLIYNPDQWTYTEYYFFETLPEELPSSNVYEILHISV